MNADTQPALDILMTLGGIAWEASEAPDTRCWGLLPEKIQVLRIEAPVGRRTLKLQPADAFDALRVRRSSTQHIVAAAAARRRMLRARGPHAPS